MEERQIYPNFKNRLTSFKIEIPLPAGTKGTYKKDNVLILLKYPKIGCFLPNLGTSIPIPKTISFIKVFLLLKTLSDKIEPPNT